MRPRKRTAIRDPHSPNRLGSGPSLPSAPVVAFIARLMEDYADESEVRRLLPYSQAEILWCPDIPANSGYDEDGEAPFGKAINVYAKGYPR